ncbi:MAG: ABC transporter permease [Candidatus Bathyarchaeia archaeon]
MNMANVKYTLKRLSINIRNIKENSYILAGLCLLISIVLFAFIGILITPYDPVKIGSVPSDLPPSFNHLLGTDSLGRDLFTQLCFGTLTSLQIGFLAGIIGFFIALIVAFVGGYYGGTLDSILTILTEVFLTTPTLVILIIIASVVERVEIPIMATIIAAFAWAWPSKTIRAQVLSLKERGFIYLSKLSGLSGLEIIFKHMIPNILPFLGSYFAVVVSAAMLSEVGLEVLGLGPRHTITLGMMLHWAMMHAAVTRNLIWWWLPPCIMLFLIFLSLFLIQRGLDIIANPRLKGE